MAMISGSRRRLSSNSTRHHFANLSPVQQSLSSSSSLSGFVGFIRILLTVTEMILSATFPYAAPGIIVIGGAIQQGLDTYHFLNNRQSSGSKWMYGIGTIVNILPIIRVVRDSLRHSKNVLKVIDVTAKKGIKYVVKGTPAYDNAANELASGLKTVSQVSVNTERALRIKKIIPVMQQFRRPRIESAFEIDFQKELGILKKIQGGNKFNYDTQKQTYWNEDLSKIRHMTFKWLEGKYNRHQLKEKFDYWLGESARATFKNKLGQFTRFATRVQKRISSNMTTAQGQKIVNNQGRISSFFANFGTRAGKNVTQVVQWSRANDVMREFLNRPQELFLRGQTDFGGFGFSSNKITWNFSKNPKVLWKSKARRRPGLIAWARKIRQETMRRYPNVEKLAKTLKISKVAARLKIMKEQLAKVGTLTKDDRFLVGWRTIKSSATGSWVFLYFNPVNTDALTIGSLNKGGKRPVTVFINKKHLKYLSETLSPGHCYLKGENGYPPIALTAGGKRPLAFQINSQAFELLTLIIPNMNGLRHFLSIMSNFRGVITSVAKGTYTARWGNSFVNTFKRLWLNKITRIFGQTIGNIFSQEMGANLARVLKGVGQGFIKTKTETVMRGSKKVVFKHNYLSTTWNSRVLLKQVLPQSVRSTVLKRSPKVGPARQHFKYQRYGANIRRIPGMGVAISDSLK